MMRILTNGGSASTGWACPNNKNWSDFIAEKTSSEVINLSVNGNSLDRCVRETIGYTIKDNFDAVIVSLPLMFSRREFVLFDNDRKIRFQNCMISSIDSLNVSKKTKRAVEYFYESEISNGWSDFINGLQNIHYLLIFLNTIKKPYFVRTDSFLNFDKMCRTEEFRDIINVCKNEELTDEVYNYIKLLEKEISKYMDLNNGIYTIIGNNLDNSNHPTLRGHEIFADYLIENFLKDL